LEDSASPLFPVSDARRIGPSVQRKEAVRPPVLIQAATPVHVQAAMPVLI